MTIEQVSVFIENSPGTLAKVCSLLAQRGYDLLALSLADTAQYGILRCLVKNPAEAVKSLAEAGYTARTTRVLAALVQDHPGGLAAVLATLAAKDISLSYCYSFARSIPSIAGGSSGAAIVFRVEDVSGAANALAEAGVTLIDAKHLAGL